MWVTVEIYNKDLWGKCGRNWDCDTSVYDGTKIGCAHLGFNVFIDTTQLLAPTSGS